MAGIAVRYTAGAVARTEPYWSWSNPAVREVATNVAAVGGTTGAVAGVGTLLAGILGKRKRTEMSSGYATDTQMGGMVPFAGATNVQQRTFVNSKRGRKLRKNAKNAHRLLQASMAYAVERWQRIYPYGPQVTTVVGDQPYPAQALSTNYFGSPQFGRLNLGHLTAGATPLQNQILPGYLFNLTSWSTSSVGFNPMKRLVFNSSGNIAYYDIDSQNVGSATGATSQNWKPELIRGLDLPPDDCQNAFLNWSDIRVALFGAQHCPTRFYVEMIQFKKDYFDPYNSLGVTSDQQAEINMHYINEFKNLVFHPLDVNTNNRSANIKVLYRKVYEIGPDTSSSEDPASPNILCKIFKRFNRLCNFRWRVTNTATATTDVVDPNINPQAGELDQPDWQLQDFGQIRSTVVPRARVYLYIRAEAMKPVAETVNQNDVDVLRHCPSMDLIVRNKWQFEY